MNALDSEFSRKLPQEHRAVDLYCALRACGVAHRREKDCRKSLQRLVRVVDDLEAAGRKFEESVQ